MRSGHVLDGVPAPAGAYSHAVDAAGTVWTAGFGPQEPTTGLVPDGISAQTDQVVRNLATVLEALGMGLEDVVKVTVHLQHLRRDFRGFDSAYRRWFTPPFPVRTTVGSDLMDILVEIDVVAVSGAV